MLGPTVLPVSLERTLPWLVLGLSRRNQQDSSLQFLKWVFMYWLGEKPGFFVMFAWGRVAILKTMPHHRAALFQSRRRVERTDLFWGCFVQTHWLFQLMGFSKIQTPICRRQTKQKQQTKAKQTWKKMNREFAPGLALKSWSPWSVSFPPF